MTSKEITKTWWGEKWLNALKGVYYTNRIGRGKTYANTGRVYDILINDNLALAKVRGRNTVCTFCNGGVQPALAAKIINSGGARMCGHQNNLI